MHLSNQGVDTKWSGREFELSIILNLVTLIGHEKDIQFRLNTYLKTI